MMNNSQNYDELDLTDPFVLLGEFLREDGWQPERIPEEQGYKFGYMGKAEDKIGVHAWIPEGTQNLIVHGYLYFEVPREKRQQLSEFITRANYGLPSGNFEMDFDSGEIRAKCNLDFEGTFLEPVAIKNVLYTTLFLVDEYMPGFKAVLNENRSSLDAMKLIED